MSSQEHALNRMIHDTAFQERFLDYAKYLAITAVETEEQRATLDNIFRKQDVAKFVAFLNAHVPNAADKLQALIEHDNG